MQTAFTCPRTSAFTAGTEGFLRARGIELVPWGDALRQEVDLAVAAGYGGPLPKLHILLITLPHGMGYIGQIATSHIKIIPALDPLLKHTPGGDRPCLQGDPA